jgi:hypothetical protein
MGKTWQAKVGSFAVNYKFIAVSLPLAKEPDTSFTALIYSCDHKLKTESGINF